MKRAVDQTKRLANSKATPVNSDSDASVNVLRKKKASTGVLMDHKQKGNNTPKHNDAH